MRLANFVPWLKHHHVIVITFYFSASDLNVARASYSNVARASLVYCCAGWCSWSVTCHITSGRRRRLTFLRLRPSVTLASLAARWLWRRGVTRQPYRRTLYSSPPPWIITSTTNFLLLFHVYKYVSGTDIYPHMPILRPHTVRCHECHISSVTFMSAHH